MNLLKQLRKELNKLSDPIRAQHSKRYFKTGPREYGEGDIFLGINIPTQRNIAKKYYNLNFFEIKDLLKSKIHTERFIALLVLMDRYGKTKVEEKTKIFNFYLKSIKGVNNWDLVDISSPKIIGDYLFDKNKDILYQLAKSKNLWKRRISIISTQFFIKNNQFADTLEIALILLKDKEDLIHKAVGWMLREVGKKNQTIEEKFLKKYAPIMPRTMLRYAIEKFTPSKKNFYLSLK